MPLERLRRLSQLVTEGRLEEAATLSADLIAAFPTDPRTLRAHAIVLRRASRTEEAVAFLSGLDAPWAHAQLGVLLQHREPARAIGHFRQAFASDPNLDHRLALAHALGRTGDGDQLEEAYQLLRPVLHLARDWPANNLHIAFHILQRVCAYDELDRLGTPAELGRMWAKAGDHTALFLLLSRIGANAPEPPQIEGSPAQDALT